MNNASSNIVFEHPLNERMRVWLRIEFLIKQVHNNKIFNQDNALLFFHSLSELLEIIERNDLRADLSKELEAQKQKLNMWVNVEGVNTILLNSLLECIQTIIAQLNSNIRLEQSFKEDRFISSIRQRLTIPGGCCSFDLPSLYLWLNLPQLERDKQVAEWINCFSTLNDALSLSMQLIRQSGKFNTFECSNNFHQNNNDDEAELLRIRIPIENRVYPQVSGHKSRYAIRFLPFHSNLENNEMAIKQETFSFELACC